MKNVLLSTPNKLWRGKSPAHVFRTAMFIIQEAQ